MRNTKISYYLSGMPKPERVQLREWLLHSMGANSPLYARILDAFEIHILDPATASDKLKDHPGLFAQLYPDKPYNANYLHRVLSGLLSEILRFIGWKAYQDNEHLQQQCLLMGLNKRNLNRYFPNVYGRTLKKLATRPVDTSTYHHRLMAEHEMRLHSVRTPESKGDLHLQPVLDQMDAYFMVQKLAYACATLIQDKIRGTQHTILFMEAILKQIEPKPNAFPPLIQCYHLLYRALRAPETFTQIHELVPLLSSKDEHFTKTMQEELYHCAHNFCILRLNQGDRTVVPVLFEVLGIQLERALLKVGGILPLLRLRNIMTLSVRLGGTKEARSFLENSYRQLSPEHQEMAYHYHHAVLNFHEGKAKEARLELNQHFYRFSNLHYVFGARAYLCKCYFEMDDTDALTKELSTFRKALRRHRRSKAKEFANYFRFTEQLSRLIRILNGNPDQRGLKLQRFKEGLKLGAKTLQSIWLLEQVKRFV